MNFRILNCGLKLQTDGFGLDTEIGILSYLAFVQDVQLKTVLNEMVKVKFITTSRYYFPYAPYQSLTIIYLNDRILSTDHHKIIR